MLKGKTVLITGGTSGIGLAAAKLMYANGARVVITGRDAGKLAAARQEIGERTLALQAVGTSDPSQCGESRFDRHTDPATRGTVGATWSDRQRIQRVLGWCREADPRRASWASGRDRGGGAFPGERRVEL